MKQIIIVRTNERKLYYYEKENKHWNFILKTKAYIGINGVSINKREGDGKTPLGIYKIGSSFGINDKINTKLDYFNINEKLYWVTDSNSLYYNELVNIDDVVKDWKSAEHLIEYPKQYEYAIVIKYNTKKKKEKGSAIFLHCDIEKDTAGCIAISKENMIELLKRLNKNAIIMIC